MIKKALSAIGIVPAKKLNPEQELLLIQAVLAVMAILPFAAWRFMQGQWLVGLVDLAIVVGMILLGAYGYLKGSPRLVTILLTLIYTAGMLTVVAMRGSEALFWAYPTAVACYFMVRTLEAASVSCFALVVVATLVVDSVSPVVLSSFIVTYILVCLFAYLFSTKMREDRYRLEQKATIDPLTGANNRRALDDEIERIVSSVSRNHHSAALLLFDIDHFKQINDQFGHAVGDTFLKEFVRFLRPTIRKNERLFRYGGEEFVVLVEGGLEEAGYLAEQVRSLLEDSQLIPGHTVTVSIGVAELGMLESSREWMKRADDALYRAKRSGRNRVCLAEASKSWESQVLDAVE